MGIPKEVLVTMACTNLVHRIKLIRKKSDLFVNDETQLKALTKELEDFDKHYAVPIRTELNSAEKTARYKVKRRALVDRIKKIQIINPAGPGSQSEQSIIALKELDALDKEQEEQLKYKSNCDYPLENKECTVHIDEEILTNINRGKHVEKARQEYYNRIVGARGNNIKEVANTLKMLIKQARDIELLSAHHGSQIRLVMEQINFTDSLPARNEVSQWENLFIKEKSKCETLAEDNVRLLKTIQSYNDRHGKMYRILNDAITKVHTGVNTDVIMLCHTSESDTVFKALCDRVVDRLEEERPEDVKVLEDNKQKTHIIYYTDGSCIRIVNDSGCFIMEVER